MSKVLRWLIPFITFGIFAGPLWITARINARDHFARGQALVSGDDTLAAAEQLRKSLSWYSPFDGVPAKAGELLWNLAMQEGLDENQKIEVLSALKRGLWSSRNFGALLFSPYHAELMKRVEKELEGIYSSEAQNKIVEVHTPKVAFRWQLLSQLLFWSWLLSVGLLIRFGFAKDGSMQKVGILRYGSASVLFYVLWLTVLRFA